MSSNPTDSPTIGDAKGLDAMKETNNKQKTTEGAGGKDKVATAPPLLLAQSSAAEDDAATLNQPRSGRWSIEEKLLFLHGLKLFGRGRWKRIRAFLPWRSLVQIKSHGQKVLKRADAGEDIWTPLQEKRALVRQLVARQMKSPTFIMPRIPTSPKPVPARRRQVPKPKLKPRPTTSSSSAVASSNKDPTQDNGSVRFSIGNGRREEESATTVFRTEFGGAGNQSFSFRGDLQHVKEDKSSETTTTFDTSDCRSPNLPDPNMVKSTAVLAATALCQLSEGWDKKSSCSTDEHRVNIVSP